MMDSKSMGPDLWANPVQPRSPTRPTKEYFTIPPAITFPPNPTLVELSITNVAKF